MAANIENYAPKKVILGTYIGWKSLIGEIQSCSEKYSRNPPKETNASGEKIIRRLKTEKSGRWEIWIPIM